MISHPPTLKVPLYTDANGAIRVSGTRVLLELVINAWYRGESPEGIVEMYTTLKLADVYIIISYYLANREEIDEYLKRVEVDIASVQRMIDAAQTPDQKAFIEQLRSIKRGHVAVS